MAREIENYLDAHPDAADDVEGVRTWWIARKRFLESHRLVEAALGQLVAQGRVERLTVASDRIVYRRRADG